MRQALAPDPAAPRASIAPPRGSARRIRLSTDLLVKLAGVVAVLGLLELCSRLELLPQQWFPPVTAMYAELGRLLVEQPLWVEIGRTLRAWAVGIGLAAVVAIPVGVALGSSILAYRMLRGVIEFCRPIPSVALVMQSQRTFEIAAMWGGVILLGVVGLVLSWLFVRVESRVLRWHRGATGVEVDNA